MDAKSHSFDIVKHSTLGQYELTGQLSWPESLGSLHTSQQSLTKSLSAAFGVQISFLGELW